MNMKYKITVANDDEEERELTIEAESFQHALNIAHFKMREDEQIVNVEEMIMSSAPENRVLGKFRR